MSFLFAISALVDRGARFFFAVQPPIPVRIFRPRFSRYGEDTEDRERNTEEAEELPPRVLHRRHQWSQALLKGAPRRVRETRQLGWLLTGEAWVVYVAPILGNVDPSNLGRARHGQRGSRSNYA